MKYEFHVKKKLLKEKDRKAIRKLFNMKNGKKNGHLCFIDDICWLEWDVMVEAADNGAVYLSLCAVYEDGELDTKDLDHYEVSSFKELEEKLFEHIWKEIKDHIDVRFLKNLCVEEPKIVLITD